MDKKDMESKDEVEIDDLKWGKRATEEEEQRLSANSQSLSLRRFLPLGSNVWSGKGTTLTLHFTISLHLITHSYEVKPQYTNSKLNTLILDGPHWPHVT